MLSKNDNTMNILLLWSQFFEESDKIFLNDNKLRSCRVGINSEIAIIKFDYLLCILILAFILL